jgi:hypothetical protein
LGFTLHFFKKQSKNPGEQLQIALLLLMQRPMESEALLESLASAQKEIELSFLFGFFLFRSIVCK